jgi:Ca2+-binding RTX toxin-like protein
VVPSSALNGGRDEQYKLCLARADTLTGSDGANTISGGGGDDNLTGAGGGDTLQGGDGNDSIAARDTVVDAVACGAGTDSAVVDPEDTVAECEVVDTGVPDVPPPVLGKSFNIEPLSGTVYVILPAGSAAARAAASRRHRLEDLENVPIGSKVDTRKGAAVLTSARNRAGDTQSARFSRGLFTVKQAARNGAYTELVLSGAGFRSCRTKRAAASASKARRTLFGSGKGRFRTKGRFSSATVRGTEWGVRELCEGTLTRVRRGTVLVRDFRRHRTIKVRTGHTYLAKASRR